MKTDEKGRKRPIDTAIVMNEKFVFKGYTENAGLYTLTVDNLQRSLPLLLTNEKMSIEINKSDITKSKISGSKANTDYNRFNKGLEAIIFDLRKLTNEKRMAIRNKDTSLYKLLEDELKKERNKIIDYGFDFIRDNPNSISSLVVLDQQIKAPNIDGNELLDVYNSLGENLKTSKFGVELNKQIEEIKIKQESEKATAIGAIAPNFSAPNPDGEEIALKDVLSKGKITIVDFWAAWCGPCRKENPNVVRVYEKYHDKGLEIIGVSLDGSKKQQNPKKAWLDAIEKDRLTWHQVSNLKYFGPIAEQFNVTAIPKMFVLDSTGKILAKNLRGPALDKKVSQLLSE